MKNEAWLSEQIDGTWTGTPGEAERSPLLDAVVMMVDDDELMIELVQGHLEDAGYRHFVSTTDPAQTLALLRRDQPAVLLLDLMMPGISGFDVLQRIRTEEDLRFLPVIVLTAATGADAKLRALQLGATDFLSKPVDASELVLRVRNTLAFRQYHERSLNYDEASGLPTRRLFEQQVRDAVARAAGGQTHVAVLNISVPECRQVAETLGHEHADALARALAGRLQDIATRHPDAAGSSQAAGTVARLRTEEFGLLITGVRHIDQVERIAKQVLADLALPVQAGVQQLVCTAVAGIALSGTDGQTTDALLKGAEQARTQARLRNGSGYEFFSSELNRRSLERMSQATQLRRAVDRQEFVLHYQPKVDMHTGGIAGAEALVRWQHPNGTLLPPKRFITLAEELGMITAIGEQVLLRACQDAVRWMADGVPLGRLSVNVSQAQFVSGGLSRTVAQALKSSGLAPKHLTLEITESMLMADVHAAIETLHEIKALGVELAIDDFGTGYSSLSYLKVFPVGELKIDRSFVADLPGGPKDAAILRAIVALGHHLGMQVVAEGVETAEQMLSLHGLGCDMYQGFLFSRPVPEAELIEMLRAAA